MASIRNTTLLYRPSLSVWTARRLDKGKSREVNESAQAVTGAANVNKQLLPDCPELTAIQKWANSFRTWVYLATSPWDDGGWRVGSVVKHMDFMQAMTERIAVGEALVDTFALAYPQLVADAEFKLGDMFNPMEYPTVAQVRDKFAFSVEVQPMPATEDLRVMEGVPQAEVDRLVAQAESSTSTRIEAAMADARSKLVDAVEKFAVTLEGYEKGEVKRFNNSLVENMRDIADVMPGLNIAGDASLDTLAQGAGSLADMFSAGELRDSDHARSKAASMAREMLKAAGVAADVVPGVVAAVVPTTTPEHPTLASMYSAPEGKLAVLNDASNAVPAASSVPSVVCAAVIAQSQAAQGAQRSPASMFADLI